MHSVYNFFRRWRRSEYTELDGEDELDVYPSKRRFKPHKFPQYLATFTANIGSFALGCAMGWTSESLPNIEERGDLLRLKANSELATWIGAMSPLGSFFSGFVAGSLVDQIGRKRTMLSMAPPFVVGWLMIAFAPSVSWVLAGRFIVGFCGGAFSLLVPVYASETAEDSIRGLLSNSMDLVANAGILFIYVLGRFCSWRTSSLISSFIPAIFAVGMWFMPETPIFLISNGKRPQAQRALMWLRGATLQEDVAEELKSIEASIERHYDSATWRDLMTPAVLKPALICVMLMLFQQFGGINGVLFYAVDIFKDAGTSIDYHLSAIILALVQVAFVLFSTLTVEYLGRRILLIVSQIGNTISLLALGAYFFVQAENPAMAASLGWLPLTSLIVFILSFNFGLGPVPWTIMGELPPPHAKGLVSSIAAATSWGSCIIITKFFKNMTTALTQYGCYWLFSGVSFVGLVFCILVVPETKGKSAMEIQRGFEKRKTLA